MSARPMRELGKLLVVAGVIVTLIGAVLWKSGGFGGLGRLPGDLFIQRGHSTFVFPIATCILISLVLTLAMWLLRR